MSDVKVTKESGGAVTRPEAYYPFPFSSLFGVNPYKLMKRFTDEMDRALGGFMTTAEQDFWAPAVDVKTANGNLVVTAELPGLTKDDIKVEVIGDALVIEGERKKEEEQKGEQYYRSERYYGKFYRSIPLPKGANTDAIKADLNNGVLQVTIPVPEIKPTSQQIPIGTGTK